MKTYKYIGIFKRDCGNTHEISVNCNGFLQAFFLLTAKAINAGKHYQLHSMENEEAEIMYVDNILHISNLIKDTPIV